MTLREWIDEGPLTLALSSSFFGFFAHCGVVDALYATGFRPRKITGASAGALVGAALASGLEPNDLQRLLFSLKRQDFWDPAPGPGFLRGRKFRSLLQAHLVDSFHRTKVPFECAVFDVLEWKTKFLSEGSLPLSVVASCSVPFMFHPVRIGTQLLVDGGIFHKSGVSPEDKNDRVLCVYLESDRSFYERPAQFERLPKNHRVLRFTRLPQILPHRLDTGRSAMREALERTRRALRLPMADIISA